jgi:cytoskeletal protein RodZ
VETIYAATKVPAKHIRALEARALEGVFRRGFVRGYLGGLGLEEGAWMRRFEESAAQAVCATRPRWSGPHLPKT